MPPNAVYVGRPTKWGNPYMLASVPHRIDRTEIIVDSAEDAVELYRQHFWRKRGAWKFDCGDLDVSELRGKDLACWCPLNQPCHADVLLEIANA